MAALPGRDGLHNTAFEENCVWLVLLGYVIAIFRVNNV
jgi:hypothetical protein